MSILDAPWRVYLLEWLFVYTGDGLEVPAQGDCEAYFARKYQGRVRDGDWRIRNPRSFRPGPRVLELRLPNLKGEFKDSDDAWELWGELMKDPAADLQVVQRGSPQEQVLLDYGRKMLPVTGADRGTWP